MYIPSKSSVLFMFIYWSKCWKWPNWRQISCIYIKTQKQAKHMLTYWLWLCRWFWSCKAPGWYFWHGGNHFLSPPLEKTLVTRHTLIILLFSLAPSSKVTFCTVGSSKREANFHVQDHKLFKLHWTQSEVHIWKDRDHLIMEQLTPKWNCFHDQH